MIAYCHSCIATHLIEFSERETTLLGWWEWLGMTTNLVCSNIYTAVLPDLNHRRLGISVLRSINALEMAFARHTSLQNQGKLACWHPVLVDGFLESLGSLDCFLVQLIVLRLRLIHGSLCLCRRSFHLARQVLLVEDHFCRYCQRISGSETVWLWYKLIKSLENTGFSGVTSSNGDASKPLFE